MIKKRNIVVLFFVVLAFGYVLFMIARRKNIERKISEDGNYGLAIIKERLKSKFTTKSFVYSYIVEGKNYLDRDIANVEFSEKYKEGDTIFIKYLPNEADKSMIIEEITYKFCYGNPPIEGWKEIPTCR